MADQPATANVFSWLTSLSPAVIALASAVTGAMVGGATGWAVKPDGPKMVIPAADKPAPVTFPIEGLATKADLEALKAWIAETYPVKPGSAKKTKTATTARVLK